MYLEPTEACWILGICAVLVVVFLLTAHFTKLKTKIPLFYSWIGAIAIFGGALAFLLPIALNSGFGKDDDGRVLRQLILYATGGLLGVITLGETHRKNNQEKEKNANDHTRQVYAERRSRYTKAVEQLANEKAAVRLGGIYTLVGLVDEWLADDTLGQEEQQKEGQVIINNLCSYIRSPFPLAAKIEEFEAHKELEELKTIKPENFSKKDSLRIKLLYERFKDSTEYEKPKEITKDYAEIHEEQDVRRTIFVEMSKRSSAVAKVTQGKVSVLSGAWSDFDFDFSRAPIFYPLNNLTIEKPNFSSSRFYSDTNFRGTVFTQNADFSGGIFIQNADFRRVIFTQNANFEGVTFTQNADFRLVSFTQNANFKSATFTQNADFRLVNFTQNADFSGATITQRADFIQTTFTQNADFSGAIFTQNAIFGGATFNQKADFTGTTFTENVNFIEVIFKTYMPIFAPRAEFSVQADPQKHNFKTHQGSQPIPLGKAELDGIERFIPVGAVLFDPTSWDEESQDYIDISEPAKPLDDSDEAEENKAE